MKIIDTKNSELIIDGTKIHLDNVQLKILLRLSNNNFNTYDEVHSYISSIYKNVNLLRKMGLNIINYNKCGLRLLDEIYIC